LQAAPKRRNPAPGLLIPPRDFALHVSAMGWIVLGFLSTFALPKKPKKYLNITLTKQQVTHLPAFEATHYNSDTHGNVNKKGK
jgi:hypothetical protein